MGNGDVGAMSASRWVCEVYALVGICSMRSK